MKKKRNSKSSRGLRKHVFQKNVKIFRTTITAGGQGSRQVGMHGGGVQGVQIGHDFTVGGPEWGAGPRTTERIVTGKKN
jgi:hypothetical protein